MKHTTENGLCHLAAACLYLKRAVCALGTVFVECIYCIVALCCGIFLVIIGPFTKGKK